MCLYEAGKVLPLLLARLGAPHANRMPVSAASAALIVIDFFLNKSLGWEGGVVSLLFAGWKEESQEERTEYL